MKGRDPMSRSGSARKSPSRPEHAEDQDARRLAKQVAGMRLTGALRLFVLDAGAIWDGGEAAPDVLRKLGLLARQEDARVVVRGVRTDEQRRALAEALG